MITTHPPAATSAPVLLTTLSMASTSVIATSPSVTGHPLPLPVPDIDVNTDPQLQSTTNSPATFVITATQLPASAIPTETNPTESTIKTDATQKSKPKRIPPKVNPKKNTALKNTTRKYVPPKINPKKKTGDISKKKTPLNSNPPQNRPDKTTPKNTTPPNTTPKNSIAPNNTSPNTTQPNTTPKKIPRVKTSLKKTPPVKKTIHKPTLKKEALPKANSKKKIQPKKKQTKTKPQKTPELGPKNATLFQTKVKQNKTKSNPKKTTPKTMPSYDTTAPTPYITPKQLMEYFSSTMSSSTSEYATAGGIVLPESRINAPYTNSNTATVDETPLWYKDTSTTTTPSTVGDFIRQNGTTHFEEVNMPSGTMPYRDVTMTSSGDVTVTSGTILSDDVIPVFYSDVGVVSDTMVLDDGHTMVIPTINSEDMTDLASSPWLDLSEYIPVTIPVLTTTSDPATASPPTTITPTTDKPAITAITRPQRRPEENRENNSIDVIYNRITGVDNDISQNNLIPKRRVNLRERTKNKRIQELLEEKRNFLLRMKRGHAA